MGCCDYSFWIGVREQGGTRWFVEFCVIKWDDVSGVKVGDGCSKGIEIRISWSTGEHCNVLIVEG